MLLVRFSGMLGIVSLFAGCAQNPPGHPAPYSTGTAPEAPLHTPRIRSDTADDHNGPLDAETWSQQTGSALQSGNASWYASRFQGRRTANGERYDGRRMTAAHRSLPLGSYVRVTSLATSRSVVVRINDRGPFIKGRIIDLSYAAASALGLMRASTMRVQIERVEKTSVTQTGTRATLGRASSGLSRV
jgi:rare lipoprotein A